MLNISENSVNHLLDQDELKSLYSLKAKGMSRMLKITLSVMGIVILILMFMPWTQIVNGKGKVTTLRPDQRPQELQSALGGRIENWYVREGDFVEAGDTLLFISEIKADYFDPSLLPRTQSQIDAKQFSVTAYQQKVVALENQITMLERSRELKMAQARNKITQAELKIRSDSIDFEAAKTNIQIAEKQNQRMEQLYNEGLKSLTDLETRRLKLQEAQAKLIGAQNKLLTSQNELLNAQVLLNSAENEYNEKIAKAKATKFETLSGQYDAEAAATKLQSNYAAYEVRSGMYYIKAPQAGYVTKTTKTGIGETIKQGEKILTIMPANYDIAVEMYVDPVNLPLVSKGTNVRLIFDGWPAIVFAGWPGASYGTYAGKVVAVDNFASENGKFRMLVAPDEAHHPWPEALRVGSGAKGMALLNDVPIGYEIWRQLNGFPPEFYNVNDAKEKEKAEEKKKKK